MAAPIGPPAMHNRLVLALPADVTVVQSATDSVTITTDDNILPLVRTRVENGVLTISGERKLEKEEQGKKFHRIERAYGRFVRSFVLPDNVDPTKVTASMKDGVLEVRLVKAEQAKPKQIEISVN